MKKIVRFLILLTIVSLSCNSATDLFTEPGLVEATGPIITMTVAASLDDQGRPVDTSFTYPADQPQMVVLVSLGEVAPGPLTFNWYRVTESGDEALFEQTVVVEAGDSAYSTGLNPGILAAGTYKVVATFAGESETIAWDVAESQPEDPTAPVGTSASASGGVPAPGPSGTVPVVAPPAGTQNVSGAWATPLITIRDVAPQVHFKVYSAWQDAQTGPIISPKSFKVQVTPAITGFAPGRTVEFTHPAGKGTLETKYPLNPCALPGERDVPGTSITITAITVGYGAQTDTQVLGADTTAPKIDQLISDPSNRAPVEEGQEIVLTAIAEEIDGRSWQTGISKIVIKVTNPTGVAPFSVSYADKEGKSCKDKSWKQTTEPAYKYEVPKGVKGDVEICAFAEDFAGKKSLEKCYTYPTGKQLTGTLNHGLQSEGPSNEGRYNLRWQEDAELTLSLAPDGTLSGTAQIDYVLDNVSFQSAECGSVHEWIGPVELTLGVSGTWTEDAVDFYYTTETPIMGTRNFEGNPACGLTGTEQIDFAYAYVGGERFHAAWDGQAYTVNDTHDCRDANNTCTTTLKIRLAPPAPAVGSSPGPLVVAGGDLGSVDFTFP